MSTRRDDEDKRLTTSSWGWRLPLDGINMGVIRKLHVHERLSLQTSPTDTSMQQRGSINKFIAKDESIMSLPYLPQQ
ncbi:hypothetical protein V6N13_024649 [Hibiscus sabdariffa]